MLLRPRRHIERSLAQTTVRLHRRLVDPEGSLQMRPECNSPVNLRSAAPRPACDVDRYKRACRREGQLVFELTDVKSIRTGSCRTTCSAVDIEKQSWRPESLLQLVSLQFPR